MTEAWTRFTHGLWGDVYVGKHERFLSIEELDLSEDEQKMLRNAHWFDSNVRFILWILIVGLGFMAATMFATEDFDRTQTLDGLKILLFFALMIAPAVEGERYHRDRVMVELMDALWDKPAFREQRERYTFFYLNRTGVCFTNVRPHFSLCLATRFRTDRYLWMQARKGPLILLSEIALMIYLRVLWAYFFNPIQGAFLEYDAAGKRVLKEGDRVLIIGAGSVPHHMRWKKRLGPDGSIVALDLEDYMLRDSHRIERVLEWIRLNVFRRAPRFMTEYVQGDAGKLPFGEDEFSVVIAIRCYYVSIPEAMRVLRSDGTLCISNCGDVEGVGDYPYESTWTGGIFTKSTDGSLESSA